MKKSIFFSIFILVGVQIYGQTFSKMYNVMLDELTYDFKLTKNGFASIHYGSENNSVLCKYNFSGELIATDTLKIIEPGISGRYGHRILETANHEFFISGIYQALDTSVQFLSKSTHDFKILWTKFYETSYVYSPELQYLPNGDLILLSEDRPIATEHAKTSVYRLDTLGNIIWKRIFSDTVKAVFNSRALKLYPNGDVLVTASKELKPVGFTHTVNSSMTWKLDSAGNIKKSVQLYQSLINGSGTLASEYRTYSSPTEDGGAYVVYEHVDDNNWSDNKKVVRLDSNFQISWEHTKDYYHVTGPDLNGVLTCKNNDVLVWGRFWMHYDPIINHGRGVWLMRLDPNGKRKWHRTFQDTSFIPRGQRTTADGSGVWYDYETYAPNIIEDDYGYFVGAGNINMAWNSPEGTTNAWIWKLDSMGCFLPGCQDSVIYLNSIISAVEPDKPIIGKQTLFKITPNPAQNFIEMTFFEPFRYQNARIQAVSESGKVVFSESIPAGISSKKINSADWPPGIYFLSFSENGRVFQTEKVVVSH